jgi:hypothetical protein
MRRIAMSKVVLVVSMSLEGFTADPNVRGEEPMGDGGERLHTWTRQGTEPPEWAKQPLREATTLSHPIDTDAAAHQS